MKKLALASLLLAALLNSVFAQVFTHPRDQIALQIGAIQMGYDVPFAILRGNATNAQRAANALAMGRNALDATVAKPAVKVQGVANSPAVDSVEYRDQLYQAVEAVVTSPAVGSIKGSVTLVGGKKLAVTATLALPPNSHTIPIPFAVEAATSVASLDAQVLREELISLGVLPPPVPTPSPSPSPTPSPSPAPAGSPRWAWVKKIDSGMAYVDDKTTALALASDGIWIGGETLGQHYIQKFGFNGQNATQRFLLGKGDSVNALVAGPDGRVFGAADVWTDSFKEHRPARFFEAGNSGLKKDLALGTSTVNGTVGYGDAYGIDYFGGAVYLTGYVRPETWENPLNGYFQDKILDLTGKEVPGYALFIAKILPGSSSSNAASVEWVKYGGLEIGEAIKVSNDGIFVAGDDGYIRGFSSSGNLIWEHVPAESSYSTYSLAIDNTGHIWVAGENSPEIRKFHKSTGQIEATVSIPGVVGCMGICAHPDGGMVVNTYGSWPSEPGREAGFRIYRMLGNGSTTWSMHIAAGTASRSSQAKVAVSAAGDVYIAFTAGDSGFPVVEFEGYSEKFPFVQNSGASKGFLAAISFK